MLHGYIASICIKTSLVFSTCLLYYVAGVLADGIFIEQLGAYINKDKQRCPRNKDSLVPLLLVQQLHNSKNV